LLTGNELSQNIKYYFFDFQHFVGFRKNYIEQKSICFLFFFISWLFSFTIQVISFYNGLSKAKKPALKAGFLTTD